MEKQREQWDRESREREKAGRAGGQRDRDREGSLMMSFKTRNSDMSRFLGMDKMVKFHFGHSKDWQPSKHRSSLSNNELPIYFIR